MSGAVVDASVAIKWVIQEAQSDLANDLRRQGGLLAPDLLFAECANVLWKWTRRGGLSSEEASWAIRLLGSSPIELVPSRSLAVQALDLAQRLDHPVYDCLYLALALESGRPLVTADRRFAERITASGVAPGLVQALGG